MINPQLQSLDPYGNQMNDLSQTKQPMQQNDLTRMMNPNLNPNIKPSGAPVNFNPKQTQTINSVFGMPVNNSLDRSMPMPIQQDNQAMY
jgi:hypothetical protein